VGVDEEEEEEEEEKATTVSVGSMSRSFKTAEQLSGHKEFTLVWGYPGCPVGRC
jgi:hypothetical protein